MIITVYLPIFLFLHIFIVIYFLLLLLLLFYFNIFIIIIINNCYYDTCDRPAHECLPISLMVR